MARPRTPLLSRERIVTAALLLIDTEGLDALSTRRLATELSVSGPSLYNHVATKDDLLDAVVDSVMGEVDLSMFTAGVPWPAALRDWARSYRAALAAHPNIVPVLAQGPGRRPNALRLADAVFGCLVEAGWPRGQATRIGALMRYFVTGSALASFAAGFPEDAGLYDAADYPHLGEAHRLAEHRGAVDEGAFETGLEALLDGLALRYERTVRQGRPGHPGHPDQPEHPDHQGSRATKAGRSEGSTGS
ncbi:TetR/AcrR family transcriptional regulator C-terminal domain-containing protein [Kitasatospora sp. NPDC088548]|uniref:TetR/AcrR family transcriptional regulator C-terminal domain-containing protein n=1 Tax=Kitasatospora sp. NPDC088548 TaxID=3364075 RepID=UPI00382B238D